LRNEHFESLASWKAAAERVGYRPHVPRDTVGQKLESLSLFVKDHKLREVPPEKQALEAYYGSFSFSQSRPGVEAARVAALGTSYGSAPQVADVVGCEARSYERGPDPPPDDPDPRMPAVVVWACGDAFFLLASETLEVETLLRIARSVAPL